MKIITNTTTIFNALAASELEYAGITDYSSYELLVGSQDHTIITTNTEPSIIWMNADGFCEYLANPVVDTGLGNWRIYESWLAE